MSDRNISVTLECFVQRDGKYLMLHRGSTKRIMPNVWMAPGGRREFTEGLFDATRREIREETYLEINNLKIRATGVAFLHDLNLEIYLHLLTADYVSGTVKHHTDEDGDFDWLTIDEIMSLDNLLAELKMVLPSIFKDDLPVISYRAVYEYGNKLTEFEVENP